MGGTGELIDSADTILISVLIEMNLSGDEARLVVRRSSERAARPVWSPTPPSGLVSSHKAAFRHYVPTTKTATCLHTPQD
jgi:hypothetical protein